MTRILIMESNTPDMVARGMSDAQPFLDTFAKVTPDLDLIVAAPYAAPVDPGLVGEVDGVIFTGSGVEWCVDDPRAEPLAAAMRAVFDAGLPVWGSCNGMQLAAVLLGGAAGASPNGCEDGLARGITLTDEGRAHPMLAGRAAGYTVPCVHRDEVTALPEDAVLLAGNVHSPVQAFAYDRNGVDFWGVQYHPEFAAKDVGSMVARRGQAAFAADLMLAETDAQAAARLGTTVEEMSVARRALELINWVAHVRGHTAPTRM